MEFTALELCNFLEGTLEGDPAVKVRKPAKIEEGIEGDVCFLANPKYISFAYTTKASVLIVNEDQTFEQPVKATIIRVKNAYTSIAQVLEQYKMMNGNAVHENQVDPLAFVSKNAQIAERVHIGVFTAVNDGVSIGVETYIHPQVYIGKNVKIGANCIIFPGAVILD